LIVCAAYEDQTSCNARRASDQCSWSGDSCTYTGNAFLLEAFSCILTNPTAPLCQWGMTISDMDDACGTAKTESACVTDIACIWLKGKGTCSSSGRGVVAAFQKIEGGSPMAAALLAQDQACEKMTTKEACVAAPLIGSIGSSSSSGGSKSTTGTSATGSVTATTTGSSKSGAGAVLPTLLAAGLALLALAAF
jgi:hypothetical protein